MKKMKIDGRSILTVCVAATGLIGTLLSDKLDQKNRTAMKKELKDEILREIRSK